MMYVDLAISVRRREKGKGRIIGSLVHRLGTPVGFGVRVPQWIGVLLGWELVQRFPEVVGYTLLYGSAVLDMLRLHPVSSLPCYSPYVPPYRKHGLGQPQLPLVVTL
jgi:hypothetical protein